VETTISNDLTPVRKRTDPLQPGLGEGDAHIMIVNPGYTQGIPSQLSIALSRWMRKSGGPPRLIPCEVFAG